MLYEGRAVWLEKDGAWLDVDNSGGTLFFLLPGQIIGTIYFRRVIGYPWDMHLPTSHEEIPLLG